MILSQTATYALHALVMLAEHPAGHTATVDEISARLDRPRNYLSKILHRLAVAGVLDSVRGPRGGFRLAPTARALTLADIVRHFDELPREPTCLLGRDTCSDADACSAHHAWQGVARTMRLFFEETRLGDLAGG